MSRTDLRTAIAARPVVLDGGLATLLEQHGHDLSSDLWSARLLRDDPGAIEAAHREFFAAGAEVATTASYQVSFEGFGAEGVDRDEVERLLRRSVELAAAARDAVAPEGWVAASVGPYGAVLADGSEYRGDYDLDVAGLRAFHRPRLDVLASTVGEHADVLAIETVPCLAEVEAVLAELDGSGVPAWLSLSAADGRTRAGEPLEEAFAMAADVAEIVAVGVNCTTPADAGAAVRPRRRARPGGRLPQLRARLGRRGPVVDGPLGVRPGRRLRLGRLRRPARRRVLPRGPAGHHVPAGDPGREWRAGRLTWPTSSARTPTRARW